MPRALGSADAIAAFVARLAAVPVRANAVNQFDETRPENAVRRRNLELYLLEMAHRAPRVLLVGEAPSYRGMRITGVPFTNRVLLQNGVSAFGLLGPGKGYVEPPDFPRVALEPTASVLWQVLAELGFLPLLWSAFPLHPFRAGNPLTNRLPASAEIAVGRPLWQELAELFSITRVVAVGNVGYRSVVTVYPEVVKVRHPSHGGKVAFRNGLADLLAAGIDDVAVDSR
ncbi:uracil-DNA glycosylase [Glaciibacter psychrotolerans]|uniref:Uracil-DNA glycosylase n=1 Tax=Glaciibacter psychrotolerans TaxID=670054 RepID=A0A7Z0J780_9MICO|nr:uracil-DNA glycosylase [Leifsonia psychrotolerans]